VRCTCSCLASPTSAVTSLAVTAIRRPNPSMPSLLGASSSSTSGRSRLIFHASACSRPPPPTMSTFTVGQRTVWTSASVQHVLGTQLNPRRALELEHTRSLQQPVGVVPQLDRLLPCWNRLHHRTK